MCAEQSHDAGQLAFYRKLSAHNLAPLWSVMADLVTPEPHSACRPGHWPYAAVREAALEAGGLISTQEAERRVLVLENPGLRGRSQVTTSLYAGVQLVLPGELARAHRHAAAALRFILEGDGAHTIGNGERVIMHPGDFVVTPSWSWHEHGNDSGRPVLWLDGLDVPLIQFLDASFAETYAAPRQPVVRTTGAVGPTLPLAAHPGAVYSYPYARSREVLERLQRGAALDPCQGFKLCYTDPVSGGYALPTLGAWLQLLPAGLSTDRYRSTDATVFAVAEGRGRSRVGENVVIEWRERDVFVVPSWTPLSHQSEATSVLFSFSDRPIQQILGLFREERSGAAGSSGANGAPAG
jgi:gentisate 1,2-dioxygenase